MNDMFRLRQKGAMFPSKHIMQISLTRVVRCVAVKAGLAVLPAVIVRSDVPVKPGPRSRGGCPGGGGGVDPSVSLSEVSEETVD